MNDPHQLPEHWETSADAWMKFANSPLREHLPSVRAASRERARTLRQCAADLRAMLGMPSAPPPSDSGVQALDEDSTHVGRSPL